MKKISKGLTMRKIVFIIVLIVLIVGVTTMCTKPENNAGNRQAQKIGVPELLYQGHASVRLTSACGVVIYIDPFAGEGYDIPADIILVTHQHSDHNQIDLVAQKEDTIIITQDEALAGGVHNTFVVGDITIEAVTAYNKNHSIENSVGYIITIDGISIYHPGDTNRTAQMEKFAERALDFVLLPMDGLYNMCPVEATECAILINARYSIPMHTGPFTETGPALWTFEIAEKLDVHNRLMIEPGQTIELR
jgi:L-ascorbate metabolism protein UlaG (beta-lactamase superfamily)